MEIGKFFKNFFEKRTANFPTKATQVKGYWKIENPDHKKAIVIGKLALYIQIASR